MLDADIDFDQCLAYSVDAVDEATTKPGLNLILDGKLRIGDNVLELAYFRKDIGKEKTEDVLYAEASLTRTL